MENLTILKNMMNDLGLNVIWFKVLMNFHNY